MSVISEMDKYTHLNSTNILVFQSLAYILTANMAALIVGMLECGLKGQFGHFLSA